MCDEVVRIFQDLDNHTNRSDTRAPSIVTARDVSPVSSQPLITDIKAFDTIVAKLQHIQLSKSKHLYCGFAIWTHTELAIIKHYARPSGCRGYIHVQRQLAHFVYHRTVAAIKQAYKHCLLNSCATQPVKADSDTYQHTAVALQPDTSDQSIAT